MTLKIAIVSAALTVLPALAWAQCTGSYGSEQAMSCVSGTQWDEASQSCVDVATTS